MVFVEYRKEDPNVPIKLLHKMTEVQVKREAGLPEFGLHWVETIEVLPWQHMIVFERRSKKLWSENKSETITAPQTKSPSPFRGG